MKLATPAVAVNLRSSRKGELGTPSEIRLRLSCTSALGKELVQWVISVSFPCFQTHPQLSLMAEEGKGHVKSQTCPFCHSAIITFTTKDNCGCIALSCGCVGVVRSMRSVEYLLPSLYSAARQMGRWGLMLQGYEGSPALAAWVGCTLQEKMVISSLWEIVFSVEAGRSLNWGGGLIFIEVVVISLGSTEV